MRASSRARMPREGRTQRRSTRIMFSVVLGIQDLFKKESSMMPFIKNRGASKKKKKEICQEGEPVIGGVLSLAKM